MNHAQQSVHSNSPQFVPSSTLPCTVHTTFKRLVLNAQTVLEPSPISSGLA